MRRLLLLVTLCLASAAQAAWIPQFDSNWVTMHVGETEMLGVRAVRTGLSDYGFIPMIFAAENPAIAAVKGSLTESSRSGALVIEAKSPGVTAVVSTTGFPSGPLLYIVVGEGTTVPRIAATSLATAPGQEVLLTVLYPHPEWALVRWYAGASGDDSHPIGEGPDVTVAPSTPGEHEYWASVVTPWATSTASIEIEVLPPRRRSVRH